MISLISPGCLVGLCCEVNSNFRQQQTCLNTSSLCALHAYNALPCQAWFVIRSRDLLLVTANSSTSQQEPIQLCDMVADSFHKPGFKLHAKILHHLFTIVNSGVIKAPLWDETTKGPTAYPNNAVFVHEFVSDLLSRSFPNLRPAQLQVWHADLAFCLLSTEATLCTIIAFTMMRKKGCSLTMNMLLRQAGSRALSCRLALVALCCAN